MKSKYKLLAIAIIVAAISIGLIACTPEDKEPVSSSEPSSSSEAVVSSEPPVSSSSSEAVVSSEPPVSSSSSEAVSSDVPASSSEEPKADTIPSKDNTSKPATAPSSSSVGSSGGNGNVWVPPPGFVPGGGVESINPDDEISKEEIQGGGVATTPY